MTDNSHNQNIIAYYDQSTIDYQHFWQLKKSLALHYGYWDDQVRTMSDALRRMNEVLANRVHVRPSDRVLDAGCGVGGSAIFLAKQFGCQVTGITLVPDHITAAKDNAGRASVTAQTHFQLADYLATSFPDRSFDIVWALESVCHSARQQVFLTEAWRILKPGGRIVVGDFFASQPQYAGRDERLMDQWLRGWSMSRLATPEQFSGWARTAGFSDIDYVDVTQHVRPSAWRLWLYSLPGLPLGYLVEWLGLRTKIQTGNFRGAHYQYRALQRYLWQYGIFTATKPSR